MKHLARFFLPEIAELIKDFIRLFYCVCFLSEVRTRRTRNEAGSCRNNCGQQKSNHLHNNLNIHVIDVKLVKHFISSLMDRSRY